MVAKASLLLDLLASFTRYENNNPREPVLWWKGFFAGVPNSVVHLDDGKRVTPPMSPRVADLLRTRTLSSCSWVRFPSTWMRKNSGQSSMSLGKSSI